MNIINFWTI